MGDRKSVQPIKILVPIVLEGSLMERVEKESQYSNKQAKVLLENGCYNKGGGLGIVKTC